MFKSGRVRELGATSTMNDGGGSHRSSVARALSSLWSGNNDSNDQSSSTWTFGLVKKH